ncbi:hypothetical protein [Isoptericola sp. NPDC019482]|uniref:hypothetical protein n=1 Tax=Isoptericola sp. NPDC019482 TaxID=3154688 RepID=UPI00347CBEB0
MRLFRTLAVSTALLVVATGCAADGGDSSGPTTGVSPSTPSTSATPSDSPAPESAKELASQLVDAVDTATSFTLITEDNDPNDLIGRPGGYEDAAVIMDSTVKCSDGLGADCGATVEIFGSVADAVDRADYIQGLLKSSPILGQEYDYVDDGGALLRVSGEIKPSIAAQYQDSFGGELVKPPQD